METIPYYQILSYLNEENYLSKYLKKPFPDLEFADRYIKALKENDSVEMMARFTTLTEYLMQKMGGLAIDGWKMRSDVPF